MEPECEDSSKVTEEAILDSLFYGCDPEKTGRVPVSRLIEFLRNTICGENGEFGGNIDDLSLLLDPDGKDVEIDIHDFHTGLKEWIQDIRKQSFISADEEYHSPVAVNCAESPIPLLTPGKNGHLNHVTSTPNASSDSVEGVGGESPLKFDWERAAELTSAIDELQLNNKRLLEQHAALKTQMEGTEDTNSQLASEVENLKKQLRSTQMLVEKSRTVEKENTELRQTVDEFQESVKRLECRNAQTEKERHTLEVNVMELGVKLSEAYSNVENLHDEKGNLLQVLAQQKQLISELEQFQEAKDELSKESASKSDRMSSVIAEISLANEELKTENKRLKAEFSELNDELYKVKLNELSRNQSELHRAAPVMASTPFRKTTLLQELEAEATRDTNGLPSPLVGSGTNLSESVDSDMLDVSVNTANHSWLLNTSLDSVSTTASMDRFSTVASQVANDFKEKKEQVLRQIDELGTIDQSPEVRSRKEGLHQLLARDVDMFTDKVAALAKEKKAEKKRVAKLLVAIKKMKEESNYLREERDKALQKLGNLSLCSDELDSRVTQLRKELANERVKVKDLEEKNKDLGGQLVSLSEDLEKTRNQNTDLRTSLNIQTQQRVSLEKELEEISRNQVHLEKLQAAAQVRIRELEWEMLGLTSQLKLERKRTSSLEDSLSLSVSRHTEELQEINELIPTTDGEMLNRSRQSPRCSSPIVTGHSVRTRLQDYIANSDAFKSILGVVRLSPDGGPLSELEENVSELKQHSSRRPPGSLLQVERKFETRTADVFSEDQLPVDSLSHAKDDYSPNLVYPFKDSEIEHYQADKSQSPNLVHPFEQRATPELVSSSSQTSMSLSAQQTQTDLLVQDSRTVSTSDVGVLTELSGQVAQTTMVNLPVQRGPNNNVYESHLSSFGEPESEHFLVAEKAVVQKSEAELGMFDRKSAVDGAASKKRNLWKKTLSFRASDDYDSYTGETLRAESARNNDNYFIDGVTMHVKPAPSDKEIEKQFKALVLAFHTDRFTLKRRLEVQARARLLAESCVEKEVQTMADMLKGQEKYCLTKDMQEANGSLVKQIDVLRRAVKRVSTQAQQDGCYQQESRMSSGVEVMISHAENLTRHLERVSEDLDELRGRQKLATESPTVTMNSAVQSVAQPLSEENTNTQEEEFTASQHEHQGRGRQNSLLNFVLALHSTSVRAKEALRSFRTRSGTEVDSRGGSVSTEREETDTELEQYEAAVSPAVAESDESTPPEDVPDGDEGVTAGVTGREDPTMKEETENGDCVPREGEANVKETEPNRSGICRRACGVATKLVLGVALVVGMFLVFVVACAKYDLPFVDKDFVREHIDRAMEPFTEIAVKYMHPNFYRQRSRPVELIGSEGSGVRRDMSNRTDGFQIASWNSDSSTTVVAFHIFVRSLVLTTFLLLRNVLRVSVL